MAFPCGKRIAAAGVYAAGVNVARGPCLCGGVAPL